MTLIFRCLECRKNYKKDFNKELIHRFSSTYEFCKSDINKFILLLRNGVYSYEYMTDFDQFNNTELPHKEAFYSSLNIEDITDADHRHTNNVFKKI